MKKITLLSGLGCLFLLYSCASKAPVVKLSGPQVTASAKELVRITDDVVPEFQPCLSPDGKKLLYVDDYISFSQIAKQIYISNDLRSTIKKNINLKFNSEIIEEKNHND